MPYTPMMKQYMETKEKYKDCILFYRLGDFYEMFFDDAKTASGVLGLTLTGRDCGMENRAPMCGIPYHAADGYIQKLVENGYKVAICEQLSEPFKTKLVDRDVIKVVTAGTVMDEKALDEKKNNYIVNIYGEQGLFSIAYLDITNGEFNCLDGKDFDEKYLTDFLVKLSPSEIICNEFAYLQFKNFAVFKYDILPKPSMFVNYAYDYDFSYKALLKQFNVSTLQAFSLFNKRFAIIACGALIEYINQTQKRALPHINSVEYIVDKSYMQIDGNTYKNLEIVKTFKDNKKVGSLLWLIDNTKTGMGARLLNLWLAKPLYDIDKINNRLDAVEELSQNLIARQNLIDILESVCDIERIVAKISYGNVSPKDLIAIKNTLQCLPKIKNILGGTTSHILIECNKSILEFADLAALIENAIIDEPPYLTSAGGFIKKGYNKELDEINSITHSSKTWLINYEAEEREKTGIKSLKVGFNKVFGFYIEVSKSYINLTPYNYSRKQTIAGGERFITQELKEMETKILGAEDAAIKLEQKLFSDIILVLLKNTVALQNCAKALSNIDVLISLSLTATKHKYIRPTINNDGIIDIKDGRHPVIEALSKEQFITNDTFLDTNDNKVMVLTGPNMAGKSTYMRQIALITLLSHIGSFVPARYANISLTDQIFTRVGASDNLIFDQSTFMVEMVEVAHILLNCTNNSLIILDEVGRGTSTFDGLSIAWSIIEFITKTKNVKTLFATHFHELTELEKNYQGINNYRITVKELNDEIVFLRKIVKGSANKSFGIEVAALAGLPKSIILRAKEILKMLETADINKTQSRLQDVTDEKIKENTIKNIEFENDIIKQIDNLDANTITPVDAFKFLLILKEQLENSKQ
ncbi:MAG: DNA mismatch repair protein MutS [Firmicutes bacterium]|nr:DNA mismatch repair protein MutS [Bacillota bacterium]